MKYIILASEVERITNEIIDILKSEGYENIDNVGQF